MNYQQTTDYLFSQVPMFQNIGGTAYNAKLDNTIAICKRLGNPEQKFKSIHLAGTNGKGSTSHYIASILQSAGLKVGLYTSPHLKDFRERIKINGEMVSEQKVVAFVAKHKSYFEEIKLSFFEMTVALAFDYFAEQQVDIALIETGLGGRLDSTNVIQPICSVITNISMDHASFLGDTLEQIAGEKAGIIKKNTPIIIGETQEDIKSIFTEKANELNAPITFADMQWQVQIIKSKERSQQFLTFDIAKKKSKIKHHLQSELLGFYQKKNIATVLSVIDLLNEKGCAISEKHICGGVKTVVSQTGLLGRWQVLSQAPLVIADAGHNEAGIKAIVRQINKTPHKKLHFVLGVVNDKDIDSILSLLPKCGTYYFCKSNIKRALAAEELQIKANAKELEGNAYTSVKDALKAAKNNAEANDLVFIGGSAFTVAEAI